MSIVVGIDASRNRSGGAVAHIVGILEEGDPSAHGITGVHVWGSASLLAALPDRPWVVRHNPPALEGSLLVELLWQRFRLPKESRAAGCSIMLNLDAGTVSRLRPAITANRDLLSYEPTESARYGFSKARLRQLVLRYVQNRSLSHADGAIFLTNYAAAKVQESCGRLKRVACIPHGVGQLFREVRPVSPWPAPGQRPVECLYISNAEPYKHQWTVIRAVARLRAQHRDVRLTLIGGGVGRGLRMMNDAMAEVDPAGQFVRQLGVLPHDQLPHHLARADLFVFASTCEAFGITLLEAMAAGLPIACSNRSCLPELIEDGCVYFDSEDVASVAAAIERLLEDPALRSSVAARARQLSEPYSWERCANETWAFVAETARECALFE